MTQLPRPHSPGTISQVNISTVMMHAARKASMARMMLGRRIGASSDSRRFSLYNRNALKAAEPASGTIPTAGTTSPLTMPWASSRGKAGTKVKIVRMRRG